MASTLMFAYRHFGRVWLWENLGQAATEWNRRIVGRNARRRGAGAVGPVDLRQHPLSRGGFVGQHDVGQELGLDGGDAGGDRLELGLDDHQQGPPGAGGRPDRCLPEEGCDWCTGNPRDRAAPRQSECGGSPWRRIASNKTIPKEALHVTAVWRTTMGIGKSTRIVRS